jgi:hypothetical protein
MVTLEIVRGSIVLIAASEEKLSIKSARELASELNRVADLVERGSQGDHAHDGEVKSGFQVEPQPHHL